MHNDVRVDPDNEIDEINELNNIATDDTRRQTGNADIGAFNQLTIDKTQVSRGGARTGSRSPRTAPSSTTCTSRTWAPTRSATSSSRTSCRPVAGFISGRRTPTRRAPAKFFCAHDGSATGGVITCTGGDFSGSLNQILNPTLVPIERDVKVKVFAPNTPQTAVNTTTVDPANVVPEGNEFDNDDQQDTTVAPCTSLRTAPTPTRTTN